MQYQWARFGGTNWKSSHLQNQNKEDHKFKVSMGYIARAYLEQMSKLSPNGKSVNLRGHRIYQMALVDDLSKHSASPQPAEGLS